MDVRSRERFVSLLTCAVGQLCKSGLIDSELFISRVDGLLGITLSNTEVFLINICECFQSTDNVFNPTQDHTLKLSSITSASLCLTQRNATGEAGQAMTNKVHVMSKKPCRNPAFQTQSAEEASLNASSNSRLDFVQHLDATVDANTATYYEYDSSFEKKDQTSTFIKLEINSNEDFQAINNFSGDSLQKLDEPNFPSEEKLSTNVLEKLELEAVEEYSAPFNPLHYAIDDKSYITSSSFGDPGDEDYPSMSSDFVTTDPNISYDSYSQPVYPLSSSSKMTSDTSHLYTFPAVAINKQLSAWQCKRFAPPRSQNQRLNPRNKFKYHYDATTLKECLELVRSYKISQREAERVFQIPRTTIQMKLAQIYPKWVAPPRQTFAKRKTFTAVNRNV